MMAKFIKDLTIEAYHKDNEHVSKSMLSDFMDCPARYKYRYIDGGEKKQSDALNIGNAVHTLALEPKEWEKRYAVFEGDLRTKDAKAEYAALLETGKTVIRSKDMEEIEAMAEALVKNKTALALLKTDGYVEPTIQFECGGLKLKARPDFLRNDGVMVDLKTCRSVNPDIFFADAFRMGYDLSVALSVMAYEALHGEKPKEYIFLAIEKDKPYFIEGFSTFQEFDSMSGFSYYDMGMARLKPILKRLKACMKTNEWPTYRGGVITPMGAPKWGINAVLNTIGEDDEQTTDND